uniref:Mitochondrial benzodiazepine receptor, putative n=1 Tax=Riptortus pedestris TaxID=329032 RepID=R4WP37_RIPPE|nr:mitochondrial benzodiazepine receptor, putative [Riptortus pedestris]
MASTLQLLGAILLPNVGGIFIGAVFNPKRTNFYDNLKKPSWNPPSWVFAPAWTTLYSSMGYASYLIWKNGGGSEDANLALTVYAAQLLVNWAWSIMFFGLESTKLGLVNFSILIPLVIACTHCFFVVNTTAGLLMVPYILWLSFAVFLNYTIHVLNKKSEKARK